MPIKPFHRSNRCRLVALAFVLASSNILASELEPVNFRLTIVPEYYAVGSARFNDLAAVDAWLLANGGRVKAIDRCGSTAEAQLLAAVGRLYPPPGQVLELRTLPPTAPDCVHDGAASSDGGFVGFLKAEDYTVTDQLGRSMIP